MFVFAGWSTIIIIISAFAFILLVAIFGYLFQKRKERKIYIGKKADLNAYIDENYQYFFSREEEYKKNHRDYDKEPDYEKLEAIYAICKIHYKGRERLKYCYFTDFEVKEKVISVFYKEKIKSNKVREGKIKNHDIELKKKDLNEVWFVSDELAAMHIIEKVRAKRIKVINIDPLNYSDTWLSPKYIKRKED